MKEELAIQTKIDEELNYKVKIENFEGPLDLLVHLIKEAKMDIAEVKLSEITDQYIKYIEQIDELDMEKASEFIEMAATLLEIKSKKILPRLDDEVPEEEDSEQRLLRQIEEYKIFKEASEELKKIENIDRMYKEPDKQANKCKIVLKDIVLDGLLDAFANLLHKVRIQEKEIEPKKIVKDRFTVAEKIAVIKDSVMIKERIKFSELIDEKITRSEVINVFLAILELLKLQTISIVQNNVFEEIEIVKYNESESEE
jgi:segregation and condensation protein A